MTPLDVALVIAAFVLIVVGSELFTGAIERLGVVLGLSEGATGSILAAMGTALPETLIPVVAILFTDTRSADEVGVGAIIGAPFMLGTLVMLLLGATAYAFRGRRRRTTLRVDAAHASRDLGFFLALYGLAFALALLPHDLRFVKDYVGWIFAPAYVLYFVLVIRTPSRTDVDLEEEREEAEVFEELELHFARYARRLGFDVAPADPPLWLVLVQTAASFGAVIVGARFFTTFVDDLSIGSGLNALLVALILAPLATELPEALNSLIWARRGKDVIALGNVAGAMVFQSTVPVTIGVLLTPWEIGRYGTLAAVLTLLAGILIYAQVRARARRNSLPLSSLMLGGGLYVVFIGYVLWTVATG